MSKLNKKNNVLKIDTELIANPSKIHWSYSIGSFYNDLITTCLATWVFKFYETEIFLALELSVFAFILWGVWNAFNDPIVGYISDLDLKFTRKKGKKYTWFLLTGIPSAFIYFIIFIPPSFNDIIIFFWLLISLCLFDTLFSFMTVNWQGIFPNKFRSNKERTKVGAYQTFLSNIGLVIGLALPLLIITQNDPGTNISSYIIAGIMITAIGITSVIAIFPSMKEDSKMIDIEFQPDKNRVSIFNSFKFVFKQKNFIAYIVAYLAQNVVMALLLASIPYYVDYILHVDEIFENLLFVPFLISSVISIPFWIKIARKYGNRVGYIFGTGLSSLFLVFTFFSFDLLTVLLSLVLIGFSMGGSWTLLYPTFSDVIDEIVVSTQQRNEGIYYGIRTFFSRFAIVIQAITFGIIHPLTGFIPESATQTILAQNGIKIGMLLVPAFFYLLGCICMWRIYDLKLNKVQIIKEKLKDLNL